MSLFSAVADLLKPAPPPDDAVVEALDRVAELVDPLLKTAPDFTRHLASPLRHALGYCAGLVAALPGPVDINRHAFADDPLVHALFATANDVEQMLGRSQAVRDFLAQPCSWESDCFYAMFAARRQNKKQLGMERQGDLIRNDVPQVVLYFSDHTLLEPDCALESTRHKLRAKALDSLFQTFHSHLEKLRAERTGLRADVSAERAHLTALRVGAPGREYDACTRHLAELDARLRQAGESLMPEQLVEALAEFLLSPEPALKLSPVSVTVDRLGVVNDQGGEQGGLHTLNFPELTARDQRQYLAMLVRISRDEAQEAVDRVRDQQHRFMLI